MAGNTMLADRMLTAGLTQQELADLVNTEIEKLTGKLLIEGIHPSWFIYSSGFRVTSFRRACKRALDMLLASVGILLVLPALPVIALAIKLDSPGPVLFRQIRVGKGGRQFVLHKFRSMWEGAEEE